MWKSGDDNIFSGSYEDLVSPKLLKSGGRLTLDWLTIRFAYLVVVMAAMVLVLAGNLAIITFSVGRSY